MQSLARDIRAAHSRALREFSELLKVRGLNPNDFDPADLPDEMHALYRCLVDTQMLAERVDRYTKTHGDGGKA